MRSITICKKEYDICRHLKSVPCHATLELYTVCNMRLWYAHFLFVVVSSLFDYILQSYSFCRCTLNYRYVESLLALNFVNIKHWNSELYFNDSHYWIHKKKSTRQQNLTMTLVLCVCSTAHDHARAHAKTHARTLSHQWNEEMKFRPWQK